MIFAQITDTHIRMPGRLAYGKVDTGAALERCVDHLNALAPRPECVLVTGDLADFGRHEEYAHFVTLMDRLDIPYYVVPGNHDDRDALRRMLKAASYLPGTGRLNYAIDGFPLRFLALDTLVPGQPHGEVGAEGLEWLDHQLSLERGKPTIVFMHHPPFLTGITHMDAQNCRDADAAIAVLARHPQVRALLCGHVHRFVATREAEMEMLICPGTSHAVALDLAPDGPSRFSMDPPGCLLHAWTSESRLVSHISFVGEFDGPHPFFDERGRLID